MPELEVATLTNRLAQLTRRAMAERMARETWAIEAGFRPGCIAVLDTVAQLEPVSQREVSSVLLLDPSDLVSLVDILERAGLVERRRDPADRRRYALEITTAGQLAVARLREIAQDAYEEVLAPLDTAERSDLERLLSRIVAHHTGVERPTRPAPAARAEPARPSAGS